MATNAENSNSLLLASDQLDFCSSDLVFPLPTLGGVGLDLILCYEYENDVNNMVTYCVLDIHFFFCVSFQFYNDEYKLIRNKYLHMSPNRMYNYIPVFV